MRVCHVTSAHPPEDGRIFHKECVSLAQAGYEVFLVQQGASYEKENVRIIGFGAQDSTHIGRMLKTAKNAYEIAKGLDCDLYHLHDPELLRFANALKKSGHKVIFDSHEDYRAQIRVKPYIPEPLRGIAATEYGAYETRVFKSIDGVVAPATGDGEDELAYRANARCYVDNLPIVDGMPEPSFDRLARDSICYVGSITHERGITHLVKASYRAGVKLILCGGVSESYLTFLRSLPEFDCVDYRGMLDKTGVFGVIGESFCGAAALLNVGQYWHADNMPTKVYEYLLGGIPFIYSLAPYGERFAEETSCCLRVDPEDIEAYAHCIEQLRDNPEKAIRMARSGYAAVMRKYSWEHEAEKLIAFYEKLEA